MWLTLGNKQVFFNNNEIRYVGQRWEAPADMPFLFTRGRKGKRGYYSVFEII